MVLPPGSLVAHWTMVRGPSLACENQNKPLPRPNDAIMKVVQVSADELLPLSFEACSASDRAPAPHRAWQVHSLAGRVPGWPGCQGKTAKTRRTALWPKRLLLALNVFHWDFGTYADVRIDIGWYCRNWSAGIPGQGVRLVRRQWRRCSFYLVTIHQFMT